MSTSAKNCSILNSTLETYQGLGSTGGLIADKFITVCDDGYCQVVGIGEKISIQMLEERMLVAIFSCKIIPKSSSDMTWMEIKLRIKWLHNNCKKGSRQSSHW